MENKKIIVTSTSRSRVGINIPELHFKRVWEKRNSKIAIDFSILQEMIYDPGVHYLFEQGILYIDDMDVKIELGLEEPDTAAPTAIVILSENDMSRYMNAMPLFEFKENVKKLGREQLQALVRALIIAELASSILKTAFLLSLLPSVRCSNKRLLASR